MLNGFFRTKTYWTLSAEGTMKHIACYSSAIKSGCGGCCHMRTCIWGTSCIGLGANNICTFPLKTRPVRCLLYPFVLKRNKLLLAWWVKETCEKNMGGDRTILECLQPMFTSLFGKQTFDNLYEGAIAGKDVSFSVPDIVIHSHIEEGRRIKAHEPPLTRQEMAKRWEERE